MCLKAFRDLKCVFQLKHKSNKNTQSIFRRSQCRLWVWESNRARVQYKLMAFSSPSFKEVSFALFIWINSWQKINSSPRLARGNKFLDSSSQGNPPPSFIYLFSWTRSTSTPSFMKMVMFFLCVILLCDRQKTCLHPGLCPVEELPVTCASSLFPCDCDSIASK